MDGFRIKDRVRLKTGTSPVMEVLKFEAGDVVCIWPGTHGSQTDYFKAADLEKVPISQGEQAAPAGPN